METSNGAYMLPPLASWGNWLVYYVHPPGKGANSLNKFQTYPFVSINKTVFSFD